MSFLQERVPTSKGVRYSMKDLQILEYANILEDFTTTSHEEWQAKRQAQIGLGGSDAGTIIGKNNFKDPYTLYLEKIGEIEPQTVGEAAEWGNILEPIVADTWYNRIGQSQNMTIENFNYLLQSKSHEFMLANIDRLIRKGDSFGILECKTASEYLNGEWESGEILAGGTGSGKVPEKYYAQFQHYLHVTGLDWGYFAALVGGNKFYSVYVERNDVYLTWLIEQEALFWMRMEMRIPPEIDGSDSCKRLIGALYANIADENAVEIEEDAFGEWVFKRDALKEQIKSLDNELTEVESKIKFTIGEHKAAKWNGYTITWGHREGKLSADLKLLEEKYPEVFEEVVKRGESYRQLSVSKPKKAKEKKGA